MASLWPEIPWEIIDSVAFVQALLAEPFELQGQRSFKVTGHGQMFGTQRLILGAQLNLPSAVNSLKGPLPLGLEQRMSITSPWYWSVCLHLQIISSKYL